MTTQSSLVPAAPPGESRFWEELVKRFDTGAAVGLALSGFEPAYEEMTAAVNHDGNADGKIETTVTKVYELTDHQGVLHKSYLIELDDKDQGRLLYVRTLDGKTEVWDVKPFVLTDDNGAEVHGNRLALVQGGHSWLFQGFDAERYNAGDQALSELDFYPTFTASLQFGKPEPVTFTVDHTKVAERRFAADVSSDLAHPDQEVRVVEYTGDFQHPADTTGKTNIRSAVLVVETWVLPDENDETAIWNLRVDGGLVRVFLGSELKPSEISLWP